MNVNARKAFELSAKVSTMIERKFRLNEIDFFKNLEQFIYENEDDYYNLKRRVVIPAFKGSFNPTFFLENLPNCHYSVSDELLQEIGSFSPLPPQELDMLVISELAQQRREGLLKNLKLDRYEWMCSVQELIFRACYIIHDFQNDNLLGIVSPNSMSMNEICCGCAICADGKHISLSVGFTSENKWYIDEFEKDTLRVDGGEILLCSTK